MEEKLNSLFFDIKDTIIRLIQKKNIDIDILAFNLGISRNTFIENFNKRIDDFTFYLQTLSILESWEE